MSRRPRIVPCLWLDDQAEAAASFYTKTFPEGRVTAVGRYPESGSNPSGKPPGSVVTVEFEIAGQGFTALNGGPIFTINPSISFFVFVDTAGEADRFFGVLSEGGQVMMPLGAYPWSERYAWVRDRFGVSWQITAGRRAPGGDVIVPCFLFAGRQHGRAGEAIARYVQVFDGSRVESIERYEADQGPAGMLKHGRFVLGGQEMVAMDSRVVHDVNFDEGLSLQVMCRDQAEVDRYWNDLADGGVTSRCGWLKDRFGVSWQVVPEAIVTWMAHPDAAARDRAFRAMLTMDKLDIARFEAAIAGVAK